MEETKLGKASKAMKDDKLKELKGEINDVFKALTEDERNARLPVKVFDEFFAPYFKGELENTEDSIIPAKWVEFAGGAYSEVDLIDDKGEVIATTPGLYSRSNATDTIVKKINFSSVASTFTLKKDRFLGEADQFLDGVVAGIDSKVDADDNADNDAERWKDILGTKKEDGKDVKFEPESNLTDEDFDYD